ncbi:MAG: hypothetical protein AAFY88_22550, partial [Acidobacteriota bacterium]
MSGRQESESPSPLGDSPTSVLATPGAAVPSDRLLHHLLDDEVDLDLAFERLVSAEEGDRRERQMLKATM